ncbi:hypothetical protein ABPG74_018774 [Tetrahymena malaccensis]
MRKKLLCTLIIFLQTFLEIVFSQSEYKEFDYITIPFQQSKNNISTIQDCTSPIKAQLEQQKISYICQDSYVIIQNQDQVEVGLVLSQFFAQQPLVYFSQIQNLTLSVQLQDLELASYAAETQYFIFINNCKNVNITNFTVEQYTRIGNGLALVQFNQIDNLFINQMIFTNSLIYIKQDGKNVNDISFLQVNNLSQDNLTFNSFNADIFLEIMVNLQLKLLSINSNLNQNHTSVLGIYANNGYIDNILLNDNLQNVQLNIQIARVIRFYPQMQITVNKILIQSLNYQAWQLTKIYILPLNKYISAGNFTLQDITYSGIQQGNIPSTTVHLYILSQMVQLIKIIQTDFSLIPFNNFQMFFIQGVELQLSNVALRNIVNNLKYIEIIQVTTVIINSFSIDYQSLKFLQQSLLMFDSVYTLQLYQLQIPIDPSQETETFLSRIGPPLIIYYPTSQISFLFNYQIYLIGSSINLKNLDIYFANFSNVYIQLIQIAQTTISNVYSPPDQNGGCFYFSNATTKIQLYNSTVEYCGSSQLGGGIYGGYISFAQNSLIRNCFSKIAGGGLVLSKNQDIRVLQNVTFQNNKAVYSNDDFLIGFSSIQIDSIYEYNQNFQGTGLYMKQIQLGLQKSFIMYSGLTYIIFLKIEPNYPQQGSFIIPTNQLSIFQTNITQFQPQIIPKLDQPYLVYYQNPSNMVPIQQFQLTLVDNYIINASFMPLKQVCGQGMEIILIQNSQIMCKYCDFDSASYNQEAAQLDNINQMQNLFIQEKSERGNLTGDYLCAQGSVGVECMDCDLRGSFWGESYGSYGIFQCKKCGSSLKNNILISISIFILFIVVLALIQSNFKSLKNINYAQYLSKLNMIYFGASLNMKSQTSVLIKLLSFNVIIFEVSNLVSQKSIISFIGLFQTNPLQTQIISVDCFLSDILPSNFSIGYSKLILCILFPLISLVALVLILSVYIFLKKKKFQLLKNISIMTYIYLFIFCFNSYILEYSVQSLICFDLNSNHSYSMIDLSLSCEQSDQLSKIRITGTIILVLIQDSFIKSRFSSGMVLFIENTKINFSYGNSLDSF